MKRIATLAMAAPGIWFALAVPALGQAVENAVKFDISPPLRTIQPVPKAQGAFQHEHRVKKLPLLPAKESAQADTVLQKTATKRLAIGPIKGFEGVGKGNFSVQSDPPDTNGSVGPNHYVQWVNTGLAIFDKATQKPVTTMPKPVDGNLLWTGFGGNCEAFNDGDPIVLYDKAAKRWLLTQFAVTKAPFSQCVAVSTSDDPTDTYARHEF